MRAFSSPLDYAALNFFAADLQQEGFDGGILLVLFQAAFDGLQGGLGVGKSRTFVAVALGQGGGFEDGLLGVRIVQAFEVVSFVEDSREFVGQPVEYAQAVFAQGEQGLHLVGPGQERLLFGGQIVVRIAHGLRDTGVKQFGYLFFECLPLVSRVSLELFELVEQQQEGAFFRALFPAEAVPERPGVAYFFQKRGVRGIVRQGGVQLGPHAFQGRQALVGLVGAELDDDRQPVVRQLGYQACAQQRGFAVAGFAEQRHDFFGEHEGQQRRLFLVAAEELRFLFRRKVVEAGIPADAMPVHGSIDLAR